MPALIHRFLSGLLCLTILGMLGVFESLGTADERGFPLPRFGLLPLKYPDSPSVLKKRQIDRFNCALDELQEAYRQFDVREGSLGQVIDAAQRVNDSTKEAFETAPDRNKFISQHRNVAAVVDNCVLERKRAGSATDQEVRQARYWRLMLEVEESRARAIQPAIPPDPRIPTVPIPELDRVEPTALESANGRLIDARCSGHHDFFPSSDAELAIAAEIHSPVRRYALWDLKNAKLLRFLSFTPEMGTAAYAGKDDADFGAEVDVGAREIRAFIFSTDNKIVAGLYQRRDKNEILIWETSSGKLLRTIVSGSHHAGTFFFVDETRIASKAVRDRNADRVRDQGSGLVLINAQTGETEQLTKPGFAEMYGGGSSHKGNVAFSSAASGMVSIDVNTKIQSKFNAPPPGTSRHGASRAWFSKDGKHVFAQRAASIEMWDVETRDFVRDYRLAAENRSFDIMAIAEDLDLVSRVRYDDRKLDFVDVTKGEVVTVIPMLFHDFRLGAVSRDAKRLVVATDDKGLLLLLDFPDGLPRGELPLDSLVKKAGRKVLR